MLPGPWWPFRTPADRYATTPVSRKKFEQRQLGLNGRFTTTTKGKTNQNEYEDKPVWPVDARFVGGPPAK
jgi:hypothetical protein